MGSSSRFAVALHSAALLAVKDNAVVSSDLIALSVQTNPVVVRRIVSALTKAGLLSTNAGKSGGSRLARPAAKITLLDIYDAVEGEGIFACKERQTNPSCRVSCHMKKALKATFQATERAVRRTLKGITLADIIRPLKR